MNLLTKIKEAIVAKSIHLLLTAVFASFSVMSGFLYANMTSSDRLVSTVDNMSVRLDAVEVAVDKVRYESEFNEIKITLAGLVSDNEITDEVQVWIDKNKGSKLASLTTLCEQTDHELLMKIMSSHSTATTTCRMIGAI